MKDVDLAYAAGFFDGEGHVRTDMRNGYLSLSCRVAQTRREVLDMLSAQFGGHVRFQSNKTGGCYFLDLNGRDAARFLGAIFPYLIVKRAEVEEFLVRHYETRSK